MCSKNFVWSRAVICDSSQIAAGSKLVIPMRWASADSPALPTRLLDLDGCVVVGNRAWGSGAHGRGHPDRGKCDVTDARALVTERRLHVRLPHLLQWFGDALHDAPGDELVAAAPPPVSTRVPSASKTIATTRPTVTILPPGLVGTPQSVALRAR
jgi:hypothetical protein